MPERTDDATTENETAYSGTINWDRYWDEADEENVTGASPSADLVVEPLLAFFESRGVPTSYADAGCGAGATVFDVAERYPETTVVGYDGAKPVLARNRERARENGIGDVEFDRAILPGFDPDRQFDCVSSFYTLVYVADAKRALRNLYDAVAPGGTLVFTYHNRLARAQFRNVAAAPEEHMDESSPFDPKRYAERFRLLIEGENTLSYDRIHDALGTGPEASGRSSV